MPLSRAVRRFPRICAEHPVRVRPLGRDETEEFGATQVIGLGGCSFLTRRNLGEGTLVALEIPLPSGMLTADGRIAYVVGKRDAEHEIGVEFLRVAPRQLERIQALFDEEDGEA